MIGEMLGLNPNLPELVQKTGPTLGELTERGDEVPFRRETGLATAGLAALSFYLYEERFLRFNWPGSRTRLPSIKTK